MSTRSTIWYDDTNPVQFHLYWEMINQPFTMDLEITCGPFQMIITLPEPLQQAIHDCLERKPVT